MKERDRESGDRDRGRRREAGGEIMAFPDVVFLLSALALKRILNTKVG